MKLHLRSLSALALCAMVGGVAQAQPISYAQSLAAHERIDADYNRALAACDALTGAAGKVCRVEALGELNIAQARLMVDYAPSLKTRRALRHAKAQARQALSVQQCEGLGKDASAACLKKASTVASL